MKLSFMCTILLVTLNGWVYSENRCILVLGTIKQIIDRCHLANPGTDCESGWVPYRGHCYYFGEHQSMTFQEAAEACHSIGAFLVKINGDAENKWLFTNRYTVSGDHFWVGATRIQGNDWRWNKDNTKPAYVFWDLLQQQPSRMDGEDCMMYNMANSKWHDNQCDTILSGYICER